MILIDIIMKSISTLMMRQHSSDRSLNAERPSLLQEEEGANSIEDLPDAIIYHVMSYCTYGPIKLFAWQYEISYMGYPEEDVTIRDIRTIFKTFSLLSKRLHECCKSFCQGTPILIDEQWQSKYRLIQFLCKMKMKISSLGVSSLFDEPLRASLFLYLLQECALSELKSLSICNPAVEDKSQERRHYQYSSNNYKIFRKRYNYNLWHALDAGIPSTIFDQEERLGNHYQLRNNFINCEEHTIRLENMFLRGICQSIRSVNSIEEIRLQVNTNDEHILEVIEACPNLHRATFKIGLGFAFADNLHKSQDFLERFAKVISKLAKLTSLHIESNGYDGASFSITSPSLEELTISTPKINMNQINCPNLKRLHVKVLSFEETIMSNFALPKLEYLTLDLEEWSKRNGSKTECVILSKFITTIPNLRNLDFCSAHNDLDFCLDLQKVRLHLESNSIQEIDATSHSTILTFTTISCPNLKKLSVKRKYEGMAWHCHLEEELDLLDAGYEEGKTSRGDFKNLKTLKIPDNCFIYIS